MRERYCNLCARAYTYARARMSRSCKRRQSILRGKPCWQTRRRIPGAWRACAYAWLCRCLELQSCCDCTSYLFLTLEFRIPYHRCGSQAETPCFSGFLVGLLFLCFVAPLGRLRDLVEKVGQELKAKGLSKVRIVYLRSLAVLMLVPARRGRQVDGSLCRRSPLA